MKLRLDMSMSMLMIFGLCGCGTIAAYSRGAQHADPKMPYYNGVAIDLSLLMYGATLDRAHKESFGEVLASSPLRLIGLVDTPLSACGDTLLVPYIAVATRNKPHTD